jgi:hypothetical protein
MEERVGNGATNRTATCLHLQPCDRLSPVGKGKSRPLQADFRLVTAGKAPITTLRSGLNRCLREPEIRPRAAPDSAPNPA